MSLFSLRNICKTYKMPEGNFSALQDVSIDIFPGEVLGLVGASGSGKTTLGKILIRLVLEDSGSIIHKGTPFKMMSRASKRALKQKVQMVFQDPYGSLNPQMTILEIIEEPLLLYRKLTSKERRVEVIKLLEDVGLSEHILYNYPFQLSGGQRQRVAIARALSLRPEFIIFDEAVSALDASIQAQILNLLKELQGKYGLTYLFISHDLAVVRYISTRVAVVHQGRIIEKAATEELFNNPLHPYTAELIDAIRPTVRVEQVPYLTPAVSPESQEGCSFCCQCPNAEKICRIEVPKEKEVLTGHYYRCHK